MNQKKAQSALEFVMVLSFMLVVIAIIMWIIGYQTISLTDNENKNQLDNYAENFLNEFEILIKVNEGYHREIEIPKHILENFNVTVNSTYLILRHVEAYGDSAKPYYYLVPADIEPKLETKNSKVYIVLDKADANETEDKFIELD